LPGDSPSQPTQQTDQSQQSQQSQQQAQADQAKAAQKAQAAAEAQKLAQQQLFKAPEKPQPLTYEFMNAFQSIFQEGYENYHVPQTSEGAGVFSDLPGKELQRDLQLIREFLREANRLVFQENMELPQMFRFIQTEQGGVFWQKVQQALLKGLPLPTELAGAREGEGMGKGVAGMAGREGEKLAAELGQTQAGRAMLEMLRAEVNPRNSMEQMAMVLLLLKQDGLKDSSEKLVAYLRKRWDLSEEEMQRYMAHYGLVYYQGPMPKEQKTPANLWYLLWALLAVPAAMLVGMDFIWAGSIGLAVALFVMTYAHFSQRR
jgi:hypothetical protein